MKDKKVGEFETRAFCPQCGLNVYAPFGEVVHVKNTIGAVCPRCGHNVCSRYCYDSFVVHTVRKIQKLNPNHKWWNPFNKWLSGYWEGKYGNKIEYKDGELVGK